MTRHYRLAGFVGAACVSLAACAPYPAYPGGQVAYPGPYQGAAPYAYDQGGVYVQPAPYETFGFGGGYVDGGSDWRRGRGWRGDGDRGDNGWHGDRGDNGWHGDRPRDNGGQRFGGEGFHGNGQPPPAPPRFGGGGGGSGFHGVAPAAAPRPAPAPAPAQGGGRPMQWWKGS